MKHTKPSLGKKAGVAAGAAISIAAGVAKVGSTVNRADRPSHPTPHHAAASGHRR